MTPIRWGFLGTGLIATMFAEALQGVADAQLWAVGSRTQATADDFGTRWGVPKRYASYQAVADDPNVDAIYIATPHTLHAENMQMALAAGKAVLCEKPFTINASEAAACIELARARRLLLVEAMWVRWMPVFAQIRQWIDEGQIGAPQLVRANLCFRLNDDPTKRLQNPALGGGALLDVGVYPLAFASLVLGEPTARHSVMRRTATGVDAHSVITLEYASGAIAELSCALDLPAPQEFTVCGRDGYIQLRDHWGARQLILQRNGQAAVQHTQAFGIADYAPMAAAFQASLRAGETENARMPLDETLAIMRTMDGLRADWGLRYPGE
jgi:predicted dehydrogenase